MSAEFRFAQRALLATILFSGLSIPAASAIAHGTGAGHHAVDTPWGIRGDPAKVTRTITITATEMKYNLKQLTFAKGETVKFVFINKGIVPHELMIADAAEQAEHRKLMAQMTGMTMPAGHHHDEGNVVDARKGETKVLVWSFTKTGTFQYACNYPGHAESGMTGTIEVK